MLGRISEGVELAFQSDPKSRLELRLSRLASEMVLMKI